MGPKQLAGVMDIVARNAAAGRGIEVDEEALAPQTAALEAQIEGESTALYATGRVWDDGIIHPVDTRPCSAWRSRPPTATWSRAPPSTGSGGTDDPPPAHRQPRRDRRADRPHRARAMGIETVGVYSEPDRNALHVDAVDLAVRARRVDTGRVVPPRRRRRCGRARHRVRRGPSRLRLPRRERRVRRGRDRCRADLGRADARADRACSATRSPPSGSPIEAGVPTTPIHRGHADGSSCPTVADDARCSSRPPPAVAGAACGSCATPPSSPGASRRQPRRPQSAFGDGTVFIEPYIERGRHVEVQIMGDAHGNVVHFGERECSIQRRNQKIIEEAPSPGITDETRPALHDGALALARHVGYQNAGTVEFLVGERRTRSTSSRSTPACRSSTRSPRRSPGSTSSSCSSGRRRRAAAGVAQDAIAAARPRDRGRGSSPRTRPRGGCRRPARSRVRDRSPVTSRLDARRRRAPAASSRPTTTRCSPRSIAHDAGPRRVPRRPRLARALRSAGSPACGPNVDTLVAILASRRLPRAAARRRVPRRSSRGPRACRPRTGDDRPALLLAAVFADEQRNRARRRASRASPRRAGATCGPQGQRRTLDRRSTDGATSRTSSTSIERRSARPTSWVGPLPRPTDDGSLVPDERGRHRGAAARPSPAIGRVGDRRTPPASMSRRPRGRGVIARVVEPAASRGPPAPRFADHDADSSGSGPCRPLPGTVIAVHVARRRRGGRGASAARARSDEDGAHDHGARPTAVVDGRPRSASATGSMPATCSSCSRHLDRSGGLMAAAGRPPIRIANCSGFFGDRLSGAEEMVEGGPIDVLTGDWLAELTMLILSRIRAKRPGGGFAGTFVTQMEQVMGTCLDRGIKVVSNAGGLDPGGCAEAVARRRRPARAGADDRLRRRRRPAATGRRARDSGRAAAVRRRRRARRRQHACAHGQRLPRLLGHRRSARSGRRHRHHRPGHRRRRDVRAGRVAPRLGARRLGCPRRRGRRRPRDRVQRPGHRRQLLVLHRGARASSGSASRGPRSRPTDRR